MGRKSNKATPQMGVRHRLRTALPVVAMLAAVSLWGPSFVATKVALREVPPFTTASDAALLMAVIPVFCLLVETIWFRQAIPWHRGFGIVISIFGVFLVIGRASALGGRDRLIGDVLVIAAALCWAGYSLLGKTLNQYTKLTVVTHQMLYGTLMLSPFALMEFAQWQRLSLITGLSIIYLGLMCSAITYLLYNYALKTLTASQVSTFLNLVPLIGVIAAMFLLGEQIQSIQILGGGVILAGVFLSTRVKSRSGHLTSQDQQRAANSPFFSKMQRDP